MEGHGKEERGKGNLVHHKDMTRLLLNLSRFYKMQWIYKTWSCLVKIECIFESCNTILVFYVTV